MSKQQKLLTVGDVALLLGVSERTIWRYLKKGEIPKPIRIGKGYTRWKPDDHFLPLSGKGKSA